MKNLLRCYAAFVASKARPAHFYVALAATIVFAIWTIPGSQERREIHLLLFGGFGVMAMLAFERCAFAELLALRDAEIRRLQDEHVG